MRGVPGWQLTLCIVTTLLRGAESIRMIYRARAGTFFCIFFVFLARVSVGLKTMLWVCKTIFPKKKKTLVFFSIETKTKHTSKQFYSTTKTRFISLTACLREEYYTHIYITDNFQTTLRQFELHYYNASRTTSNQKHNARNSRRCAPPEVSDGRL
jgi:hypothetical protein